MKHGYAYHHAEGQEAFLLKWMPTDQPCAVPPYATHNIGVGGMVYNNAGKLLAVRERHGKLKAWKFPGGLANLGEDISATAEREVGPAISACYPQRWSYSAGARGDGC
jgi:hypothetical protein